MKFQVGDKVIVNLSNDDGVVVEIINDKMVMVKVKDVKFPAYTDQIDFPYFKQFFKPTPMAASKPKQYVDNVKREKGTSQYKVADGVWLAFLPVFDKDIFDDDVVESLKIYLINQTQQGLAFHYFLRFKGETDFELKNQIPPFSDFYLMDIPFERLNDSPSFDFEFSQLISQKNKADFFETSLKTKAKQVFDKIVALRLKGDATFSYQLFETYPDKIIEEKFNLNKLNKAGYKIYDAKDARKHLPPPQSVVDLHVEKLLDTPHQMDSLEILTLQLATFEKYLDLALLHHLKEFTVIHGIGVGKLRDEIHEILRYKKGVNSFVNQYHPWYGYGATQIFLATD